MTVATSARAYPATAMPSAGHTSRRHPGLVSPITSGSWPVRLSRSRASGTTAPTSR